MKMQQPEIITFNLKERGREHTGNERNFNIKSICDNINSAETQELIKNRDMLGYYGHQHRLLSTLEPAENSVINGKMNKVEPAIITTKLKAYMDGTIEHKTEFIDSDTGESAYKMFKNKIGGFSSVIDESVGKFFGFDYVLSPNFTKNRGFTLDSTANTLTFDNITRAVYEEQKQFLQELVDNQDKKIALLTASLDSAAMDNEELLSMVCNATGKESVEIKYDFERAAVLSFDSTNEMQEHIERFNNEINLIKPMRNEVIQVVNEDYDDYFNHIAQL